MYENVLDTDYPDVEMMREDFILCYGRYHMGSFRRASRSVMTADEYEEFRRKVYSVPLPWMI